MDKANATPLAELVIEHGFRATCRDSKVSQQTLGRILKEGGAPYQETAEKLAAAFDRGVDEIDWPNGLRGSIQPSYANAPSRTTAQKDAEHAAPDPISDAEEDHELLRSIEKLVQNRVDREVNRRLTDREAS